MSALKGLRVLDLSRLVPGPYATMMLADLGADVVKIEEPGRGDYMRDLPAGAPAFENLNRHKKSVALDLRQGRDVFLRLAKKTDVIVESFRPGVVDKLKIGYTDISKINRRIVYCSISGYGQDGPLKDAPGHDINYLARAGVLDATGRPGGEPAIPGILTADLAGGALMAVVGILSALLARQRTKRGQFVDVSMLDGLMSLGFVPACYPIALGKTPARGMLPLGGGMASYDVYAAKDGRYVALGTLERKFWKNFCEKAGLAELVEIQDTPAAQARIRVRLMKMFLARTAAEWEEFFRGSDVPIAAVQTIDEAMRDAQVLHRKMVQTVGSYAQMAFPVRLSATPARAPGRAPKLGEHTDAVLRAAGYSRKQISELRAGKLIG